MVAALQLVDEAKIVVARDPIVEAAGQLEVSDQPSLDLAGSLLTERIKPTLKQIDASCGPVVAAAHAAHKAATAQRNELKKPLLEAEALLKGKIGAYLDVQELIRLKEVALIEIQQRKTLEEAEARLIAAVETQRLEDAAALEASGDSAAADALLDAPIVVDVPEQMPPAIAAPAPAKVDGISTSVRWEAEVTDLMALVKAIAEGKAPLNLVKVDTTKLTAQVRALDGQVRYPGVVISKKRITSARAAS